MDFKALLNNKNFLIGVLVAGVMLFALILTVAVVSSVNAGKGGQVVKEKVIKVPLDLLTTDNIGKAIEIQALLAREGIKAERKVDGSKSTIFLSKYTQSERDRALLAIVKSGLMDQNVGLEMFDKGDFTSTKEDKRIRLVRAIDGELARLIRKIPPIQNASVFISIPEQTMFSSNQKPITATVQIDMPSGDKLDSFKVKAITNLLLGSVSGLTNENISITDTNGNVYNSILSPGDEQQERMRENDRYMEQKVREQLNRLVGKGNFAATVSTFLKQAPTQKHTTYFDPNTKTSISEQTFSEGLGDQTADSNKNTNAVSVYLPNGLPGGGADSSQNRNYSRTAKETQYGVSKVETNEFIAQGTIEDISIAVTLDKAAMPPDMSVEELKELVAKAASPKASAENVTVAFNDSNDPYLASDNPEKLPHPEETGNPWWLAVALVGLSLIIGHRFISKRLQVMKEQHEGELGIIRERAMQQERQLQDVSKRAADLLAQQDQMKQNLLEEINARAIPQNVDITPLKDALAELREEFETFDEAEGAEKIRSWIEQ